MDFCPSCSKRLKIREEINEGKRGIWHFCSRVECDYKKECTNFRVTHKTYYRKMNNRTHLNKHKKHDVTLPRRKSKCPKCTKVGFNRYERRYFKNTFFNNNICNSCDNNWKHSMPEDH